MNLPFIRYKNVGRTFVRFVTIHACDGQTDTFAIRKTALHAMSWTLYRSQSSTDLHQTCHQGRVPWDVVNNDFWWKSEVFLSDRPEVELILTTVPMEKISLMSKYLENGDKYDVGLKGGQIGNRPLALDWHHDLWPWMIMNPPSSRSLQLQSNISITVYRMQQHWADTRSIERISC